MGSPVVARSGLFLLWVLAWSACVPARLSAEPPPSDSGDPTEVAELFDVMFLDPDRGWAVGERGAIWETHNGGRNWQLADSPTLSRLHSVHFADEQHGWIAGGTSVPYIHSSSAVILRTENGGRKWTRVETPTLPALKWIWFRDARHGWAVGNATALDPSGIFRSEDGGYGWQSVPAVERQSMLSATVAEGTGLISLGNDSTLWRGSGANPLQRVVVPEHGPNRLRAIDFDGRNGWVVGEGGLMLCTRDGGATWQAPRRSLPEGASREFDFRTVEVRGENCWLAGSPGTCVFYSPDFGVTWQKFSIGNDLPVNRVRFLSEQHGWAVGACGLILATHDGGKSWRVQHQGGRRVALAGIFGMAQDVPWECIARVTGEEGYFASVQLLYRQDPDEDVPSSCEDRYRDAASSVGAADCEVAWSFPVDLRSPPGSLDLIVANWNRAIQRSGPAESLLSKPSETGTAISRLEEYLVRQIRIWRPDVIVTDSVSPDGTRPLSHLASQLVWQAAERAKDASAFSGQIVVAQLEPWTVKKIYTVLPPGQHGSLSIETDRLAIRLGCSLADYACVARGLSTSSWNLSPRSIDLRLVRTEVGETSGSRELFSGVTPGAIGESRQAPPRNTGINLDSLGQVIQKQRQLEGLSAGGPNSGSGIIISEIDELVAGLSPHFAGVVLHRMAQQYALRGDYLTTAEVLATLVDRYPQHVFTESSLCWLLRFCASDEWQHISRSDMPDRIEKVAQFAQRLQQSRLPLFQEPDVQMLLVSAQRRLGDPHEASRILQVLVNSQIASSWKASARGEQWLMSGTGRSPRPLVKCQKVTAKPYLDGVLDDDTWQQAESFELKSPDETPTGSATAMLAGDSDFLYVALRCEKDPACDYKPFNAPRARDVEMAKYDHVDILLDIDRDYSTYYRLSVDHRGRTRDDCCGASQWNPQWHVASSSNATHWIIEAAVPLEELDLNQEFPRTPWSIGIQRLLPDGRRQSWSNPASPTVRMAGSGYLVIP